MNYDVIVFHLLRKLVGLVAIMQYCSIETEHQTSKSISAGLFGFVMMNPPPC
jgi:hypothetical protein